MSVKNKLQYIIILITIIFSNQQTVGQNREWSILEAFEIPGKASGLAFDGTYIYSGIYDVNGDEVYQIDPSDGSSELLFSNPDLEDCFGLTWDGSSLWTIVHPSGSSNPAYAQQMFLNGTFGNQITLPDHYMSGIAYDDGDFWVATYYPDPGMVYKVNNQGAILSQFVPPDNQPWDICIEHDHLWLVQYWEPYMIYKMDFSGNVLENHPSESQRPAGIVFDGLYLWYTDGPLSSPSTLYKIDLGGVGTPEINVPVTEYDYGTVTVGDSAVWYAIIQNIGNADLAVNMVAIPNAAPIFSWSVFPQIIPPNEFIEVDLIYKPQEPFPLNTVVTVHSSDPVNPEVEIILIGEGVESGPTIVVPEDYHDYQDVRMNAYTRWYLEIENIGNEPLLIFDVISDDEHFYIDENFAFPYEVPVLGSAEIGIWFHPEEAINYQATISVSNNDANNDPYLVQLLGEGIDQLYPMGDILWEHLIQTSFDNSPKAISSIQDITGDGIDDVIVCSEDDYVRCFNGNSSGIADEIWGRAIYGGDVYSQQGLTISDDINNDGYQDVIVGTAWADRSIIAFSGKNGDIIWKHDTHEYGGGGWVFQVDVSYDYNDDGMPDVLAAVADDVDHTGPRRIYCLDAYTGEPEWECFTGGTNFSVIGIADATGDGKADVIAGSKSTDETEGLVYGINGETGVIFWSYVTIEQAIYAVEQLDDVNGDGIKDVIAGDFWGNYYLLDATNGDYLEGGFVGTHIINRFEKLDDVSGDGHPDILFAYSGTSGIVIDGISGGIVWQQPLADQSSNVTRIDDITGDGINDVIIGTMYVDNYCYFLDGTDGSEKYSASTGSPVDAISSIPDITGDGTMEVVAGLRNGKLICYSGGVFSGVSVEDYQLDENFIHVDCYPNPFNGLTTFDFDLVSDSKVSLEIFDINGKRIVTLLNSQLKKGPHTLSWEGKSENNVDVVPGMYIYELRINDKYVRDKLLRK